MDYDKAINELKSHEQMLIEQKRMLVEQGQRLERQSESLKKQYIFLSVLLWAAGLYVVAMTIVLIGKLFFR